MWRRTLLLWKLGGVLFVVIAAFFPHKGQPVGVVVALVLALWVTGWFVIPALAARSETEEPDSEG